MIKSYHEFLNEAAFVDSDTWNLSEKDLPNQIAKLTKHFKFESVLDTQNSTIKQIKALDYDKGIDLIGLFMPLEDFTYKELMDTWRNPWFKKKIITFGARTLKKDNDGITIRLKTRSGYKNTEFYKRLKEIATDSFSPDAEIFHFLDTDRYTVYDSIGMFKKLYGFLYYNKIDYNDYKDVLEFFKHYPKFFKVFENKDGVSSGLAVKNEWLKMKNVRFFDI